MDCNLHKRPYQFVCKAPSCDVPLLCSECRRTHLMSSKGDRNIHSAQILSIRQAYEEADRNISTNLRNLRQMIMPFQNQQQIFERVQTQKKKLLQQRDEIIRQVNEVFNKQIAEMESRNRQTMVQNKQFIPFQEIKSRIDKLQQLHKSYKFDSNKLRQSLSYSEENFINQLKRNNSMLSSMKMQINEYYIYDDIRHDFFLSRLQLKKKTLNNKLLQKVSNESNLYFLINDYHQGKYLHYFSPSQKLLRIYDIQTNLWKEVRYQFQDTLPSFGATLYENSTGTFYLIGGQVGQMKSSRIISYSKLQGWKSVEVTKPRSSAMATLLYDKPGRHYILIAGGVGADKKHTKYCQIFNPRTNKCLPVSPMNFAVASGTLVTFNDSIAFRIGGLGQFKPNIASICQIAQKCDFTAYLQNISQNENISQQNAIQLSNLQKWTYMDIQIVNNDPIKKFNLFYANQAAIQINPNQILVFGGMSHNSAGVKETYILAVQAIKNKQNRQSYRYYARWINQKPLVSAEGFISLRPIVYNKKVMSLQNISSGPNEYYEKQKRLIQFNMFDWREIQNIVV